MGDDIWAGLADQFAGAADASVKGLVRAYVLHRQLLEFSGAELDPNDATQVAATAAVELEASRRDPYRQLSRVVHLVGRKRPR